MGTLPGGGYVVPKKITDDLAKARAQPHAKNVGAPTEVTPVKQPVASKGVGALGYTVPVKPANTFRVQPVESASFKTKNNLRILVRMPTRQRAKQAIAALTAYRETAGIHILLEVVVNSDDTSMKQIEVLRALRDLDCTVTVGAYATKVEAVNGGRVEGWDVLVLASDDMFPVSNKWAAEMSRDMQMYFPLLDGALHYDDGYAHEKLCTLPVMGRRLWEQFKYVYNSEYRSMWCDNEQTDVFRAMGRLVYLSKRLVEHRHPAAGKAKEDELYRRNNAQLLWDKDVATYERRKATKRPYAQFGFDSPPLWLSLCIASLPSRRQQLDRLLDHLYWQMRDFPGEVEILVDDSLPPVTVGAKRQALLERARGHFVAYIDDDDWVSHDYVARVVGALKKNPDADCTSAKVTMITADERVDACAVSLEYAGWSIERGVYCRSPNHLSAIRRTLALQVGFPPIAHGEDFDYSKWLRPLLKKEASTGDDALYYYFFDPKKAKAT